MRFDPQDPIWPNRDRFVLSNGHASMLLWSVLHLTKTQAVNADYETLGHPSVSLDDIRHFRQLDSRAPGHPEYHWVSGVETTTGPLGQGVATSVGMGIAREVARQPLQPARLRDFRLQYLCGLRRWLHDGGRRVGSRVAGGAPGARQPLLDLRQQPHHHRGEYAHHLHGGRCGPIPGVRVERPARRRRQRHRAHRARPRNFPQDQGTSHLHRSGQPHRLRRPAQAGHCGGPRRAPWRRRGPAHQAQLRLARGRKVSCARRRLRAFRRRHRRTWCEGPATMDGSLRRLSSQVPRAGNRDRADAATRAPGRLGPQPAGLSRPIRKVSRGGTLPARC